MRLALLRHWTLYEALLYANYIAVRMHTYNDAGRNKMEDLLVNMGVPLAQSKHSYSAPSPCPPVSSRARSSLWLSQIRLRSC